MTHRSAAHDHVLDSAEKEFLERGYAGARLAHIAKAAGMRPASLYHHAPGGKSELWSLVLTRSLRRHELGMRQAADEIHNLRDQLERMGHWLLSQPTLNLTALAGAGAQPSPHETAEQLYESLMLPVAEAYERARDRGEVRSQASADVFAGVFLASVTSLIAAARAGSLPREPVHLLPEIVELLMFGAFGQAPLDTHT